MPRNNINQRSTQIAITRQISSNRIIISGRGRREDRRRVDVVRIRFVRLRGARIITHVEISGNADGCRRFLRPGLRVAPAARCLRNAGFRLVMSRNNELVFVRVRRVF